MACGDDEFDCDDDTCIDISLKCNDRANCKFKKDEAACNVRVRFFKLIFSLSLCYNCWSETNDSINVCECETSRVMMEYMYLMFIVLHYCKINRDASTDYYQLFGYLLRVIVLFLDARNQKVKLKIYG